MNLTEGQSKGLKIAIERFKNKEPYTVISGYAGTGKSFLVSTIISALGIEQKDVAYVSFTGKAALVLTNKGCPNATTAHKLLYKSILMPDGTYAHVPLENLEYNYKIIVVDEVSMLPQNMWNLLLKHRIHIIALGDPGQLEPVSGTNNILTNPHIFLNEIMRQAMDSDIVKISMDIREGKSLSYFKGNDVQILPGSALNSGMLLWADQILVATNEKRKEINKTVKTLLGRDPELPQDGDRVICTRNYWDSIGSNGNALVNGCIGTISKSFDTYFQLPLSFGGSKIDILNCTFEAEDGNIYSNLDCSKKQILTGEESLPSNIKYRLLKNKKLNHLIPYEFEYGYAITTHKSQGSEWDKVLVIEEKAFPRVSTERIKWLYTAATRASKKLVIIQKEK